MVFFISIHTDRDRKRVTQRATESYRETGRNRCRERVRKTETSRERHIATKKICLVYIRKKSRHVLMIK